MNNLLSILACGCLLIGAAGRCTAQQSAPASSRPAPGHQQRLSDLLGLIEGEASPEVRRTVARELLLQNWPETPARVVAVLRGSNNPARIAVAGALAELPQYIDEPLLNALVDMLGAPDASVRTAAGLALAGARSATVVARLSAILENAQQPQQTRVAAASTLGLLPRREAVNALAHALDDADQTVAKAALQALSQAAAIDFNGDAAAARAWWEASRDLPLERWQQQQIERLVRADRELNRRLALLQAHLVRTLETTFDRAADAERAGLLAEYLSDASPAVCLLGLRLAQLHVVEGKPLNDELQSQLRELMHSAAPQIQAAAVRAVASLRSADDADRFLEMLAQEPHSLVRRALINGLGYVGDETAVMPLLTVLGSSDEASVTEAVAALGRLAERGMLSEPAREAAATGLMLVFDEVTPDQVELRERLLWAMAIVRDKRFGQAFAAALSPEEGVAVRQAAVRGIAALKDPQLVDALLPVLADPDAGVRKSAIETVAILGTTEQHLEALWQRLIANDERDESIRQAAWRGVLTLVTRQPVDRIELWISRLPTDLPGNGTRLLELLQALARKVQESQPAARYRLGLIRLRIAAQHEQLGQPADAIRAYQQALADLETAKSPHAEDAALALLRCALQNGLYSSAIAAALEVGNPGPPSTALWSVVSSVVQDLLAQERTDDALALLDAVAQHPPAGDAEAAEKVLSRLRDMALQGDTATPTSTPTQPTSAPTSPPTSRPTDN